MSKVVEVDHPLIRHKLTLARDKKTQSWLFRELIDEITYLMLYESTRDLTTKKVTIETPLATCESDFLADDVVVIPVLRAGLGMLHGFTRLMPKVKVGFIGLSRSDDSPEPVEYYFKTPPLEDAQVIVVDPMLAGGGSVVDAIAHVKKKGANRIRYVAILAAPEGVAAMQEAHPDVDIYCAAVDKGLNEKGYIIPGIGDCEDRLFVSE